MDNDLRRTPLCEAHQKLGGRMVEFGGWYMPVQYSGVLDEHHAVRNAAGLFDVSHMGEIFVTGAGALAFLEYLTPNAVSALADGQCHYTFFLTEKGTFIDDLLIYRFNAEKFLLVVNAGNQDKDFAWVEQQAKAFDVTVDQAGPRYAQIAIQGPKAESILARVLGSDLSDIRYYWFRTLEWRGMELIVSRTGYTGEDGFEIYLPNAGAVDLWNTLLESGSADGLVPAGLGARDTLRLEAKMCLYGNDIHETTTPLEAGLSWVIKWDKGDFIGKAALLAQKAAGPTRKLVCLEMLERGIARHGYPIEVAGNPVGEVTSGSHSPTLNQPIALGYVAKDHAAVDAEVDIRIRNKTARAKIVKGPFYKRKA